MANLPEPTSVFDATPTVTASLPLGELPQALVYQQYLRRTLVLQQIMQQQQPVYTYSMT
ncbi:MAG: hypothetical protein ABI921_09645 [Panacibacter sp.]